MAPGSRVPKGLHNDMRHGEIGSKAGKKGQIASCAPIAVAADHGRSMSRSRSGVGGSGPRPRPPRRHRNAPTQTVKRATRVRCAAPGSDVGFFPLSRDTYFVREDGNICPETREVRGFKHNCCPSLVNLEEPAVGAPRLPRKPQQDANRYRQQFQAKTSFEQIC